jgi:hypothetical protein
MDETGRSSLYRESVPVVDANYVPGSDHSPAETIVGALAEATGVDAIDLPPLHTHVDLDALNALFDRGDETTPPNLVLSFWVHTWNVFVRADGRIRVCDGTQRTDPEPVFASTGA